ncbi:MAG: cytochrome c3 family protein [Deltaproteobacteria bacterium]|nr:cytochrome c3 family protein [Deltaproteobacteria bacterium]
MRGLGIIVVFLSAVALAAQPASAAGDAGSSADGGPPTSVIYHLSETYEPVTFSHKRHQAGTECGACHHHQSEVERTPPCRECHGLPFESKVKPGLKAAYHWHCMNCHRVGGKGPLGCDGCHAKKKSPGKKDEPPRAFAPHVVTLGHLSRKYQPVTFDHLVHTETADRCDECHHHHGPVEKTPPCRECHNTRQTAPGSKKPGLEEAYHRQCKSCHRPETGGPTTCESCHPAKPQ